MSQVFDAVVIGAGMVGASAALALARKGFSVGVVEQQSLDGKQWQPGDEIDLRVSAISPASQQLLAQLGVWSEIQGQRCADYHRMCVWHENGDTEMHFAAEQGGAGILGSIVENALIQAVLVKQLSLLGNVSLFSGQSVETVQQSSDGVSLHTSSGQVLTAQLLIAADGRQSSVRKKLSIPATAGTYDQTAIVGNIHTQKPHQSTAWQRFLATGPVALLPLANGMSSIVWSADTARAEELLQLSDVDFMQQLSEATEFRLGSVMEISKRAGFPLSWHLTSRWLEGRVLFIGDAAHGVHPLAGQGVNLGFGDVALINDIVKPGQAIYQHQQLRRFERQRKAESATALHLFSGLKWVYGQTNPVICLARDLGMLAVESSAMIKRQVIRSAMHNMG